MDEFSTQIEALEHQWMRAWMQRDRNAMKALAARDFIFLLGSSRTVILDRASWLEAATTRFQCSGYRFEDVYVRQHGPVAIFAARLGLEASVGDRPWSGERWLVDLWKRQKMRRKWKLIERTIAVPDRDDAVREAVRAMQLWR